MSILPIDINTNKLIGSVSKFFGSYLLAMLACEGENLAFQIICSAFISLLFEDSVTSQILSDPWLLCSSPSCLCAP